MATLIESLEMSRNTADIPSDLLAWYQRWGLHFSETSE